MSVWSERDGAGRELERRLGIRAERDASLAEHTTMRVGGPADLLATIRDRFTLRGAVRLAQSRGWPLTILGRGSNVVISDAGIRGLVILNRSAGATVDAATGVVSADSGLSMAKLSTIAAEAGLTGAEFTLAIPGNVGGAVWASAGAHGGEIAQIIQGATILHADGSEEELPREALELSYRSSRFKGEAGRGEVILGAAFQLQRGDPELIRGQLEEIRRWRREHQPLGIPSAGSVFRNPPGDQSAGALIDAAGLKGRRIGGAEISTMHANWILNRGGATAAEIRELHELCVAEVQRTAGITLESEIVFLGEGGEVNAVTEITPSGAQPLPHVVVLYGGRSAEAEISVVSGSAISAALMERGLAVSQLLILRNGLAALLPDGHLRGDRAATEYTNEERARALVGASFRPLIELLNELSERHPGAVFIPALHGPGDEDGEVQQALDAKGVAFVGARPGAAALGMNKARFKDLAASLGIPVLPHMLISAARWKTARAAVLTEIAAFAAEQSEAGALIGKPVAHGSSIGMRIARTPEEWPLAVDLALEYGDVALLEPYLTRPRELEIALLERADGSVVAYGPGEVFPGREFYDYDAKYADGVSRTTTAPDLSDAVSEPLRAAALQLFRAFGGRGLARMDFLMRSSGPEAGRWYISEVNTFPGFTPISLFPALVTAAGCSFSDLCVDLVVTAQSQRAS